MSEPSRPTASFTAYVENQGDRYDVTYAVQDAYDVAVNSLDFGSGFLSTEEVENLRLLGKAIGAEPLHYKCSFREARTLPNGAVLPAMACDCGAYT